MNEKRADIGTEGTESWTAFSIRFPWSAIRQIGIWRIFWGADVFFNGIPFFKCLVLVNILFWILMWRIGR